MAMKKCFLSAAFLLFSLLAFAQFNNTDFAGTLARHHGGMRLDGIDLTPDEQFLILSDINGQDLNQQWAHLKSQRALGEGLIIGGSSVAGVGALTFVGTGLVYIVCAMFVAIGGQEAIDNLGKSFEPWFVGSAAVTGVGAAAAITGIPILVVNNKKMDAIVNDWNMEHTNPDVSFNFGAAPSGVGFTVNF